MTERGPEGGQGLPDVELVGEKDLERFLLERGIVKTPDFATGQD